MNTKTKIVVIHMRHLIIGAIAAAAAAAAIIFLALSLLKPSDTGSSSGTSAGSSRSDAATGKNAVHTYTPGVYTSTVILNGTPVDIQVTVDKNNINSIEMVNISDSITTMYPLIQTNFDEIAAAVKDSGTAKNIPYDASSKYTSTLLLNAIQSALDKCTIQ